MAEADDTFNLQALAQLCLDGFATSGEPNPLHGLRAAALLEAWGVVTTDRPTPAIRGGEDPEHYLDRTLLYLTKVAGDPRYATLTPASRDSGSDSPREDTP